MYDIVFGELDSNGNPNVLYTFDTYDDCINPRTMGKEFNAIGDLPMWFYEGATVHVKANLTSKGGLATSGCTVTQATGENNSFNKRAEEGAVSDPSAVKGGNYLHGQKGKDVFENILKGEEGRISN